MTTITLTSDFGCDSPYVAQMKAVLYRMLPHEAIRIVDVTHSVAPQDRVQGAIVLRETIPFFAPNTIHIAVVDPGVGTERRLLVLKFLGLTEPGEEKGREALSGGTSSAGGINGMGRKSGVHYVLAPDNGLVTLLCETAEKVEGVFLRNPLCRHFVYGMKKPIFPTFHGRDILAPVAAALAARLQEGSARALSEGVALGEFGEPIPRDDAGKVTGIVTLDFPRPRIESHRIEGRILTADSFGNLMTNIVASQTLRGDGDFRFFQYGCEYVLETKELGFRCRFVETYARENVGTCVLLFGSAGRLEIACVNGNARRELRLEPPCDFVVKRRPTSPAIAVPNSNVW